MGRLTEVMHGASIFGIWAAPIANPDEVRAVKTVLFCGGLGTRIRDCSENIPKPMIPIGGKPILWHLMSYYSQYGHKDFVLCLGYKANVIKEFFLNYQPHIYADCVVSGFGTHVETLGDPEQDWRVTMIDTGVWRNIGERLYAVRSQVCLLYTSPSPRDKS